VAIDEVLEEFFNCDIKHLSMRYNNLICAFAVTKTSNNISLKEALFLENEFKKRVIILKEAE